jgi:hypothetical protein
LDSNTLNIKEKKTMGVYGSPQLGPYEQWDKIKRQNVLYIPCPKISDYLKWILIPSILGVFTFGIGAIVLMIVWAANENNMARANFFRSLFIIIGAGIALIIFAAVGITKALL